VAVRLFSFEGRDLADPFLDASRDGPGMLNDFQTTGDQGDCFQPGFFHFEDEFVKGRLVRFHG
jgi:hypothetical protein